MCVPICFLVATGRSPSQVRSSVRCSVRQQQLLFRCLRSSCAPRRARSSAGRIWTPVKPPVSRLTRWCVVFPSQCLLVSFFREESLLPVRLRGPVPQASARLRLSRPASTRVLPSFLPVSKRIAFPVFV
jgi:hypothetical protein